MIDIGTIDRPRSLISELMALAARQAVPPRWGYDCVVVYYLPIVPDQDLTALASRQAVPPCGSRYRVIFRAPSLALGSRPDGLRTSRPSGLE